MECFIISADQETLMSLGGLLKSSQACHQRLALIGLDCVRLPEWEGLLSFTQNTYSVAVTGKGEGEFNEGLDHEETSNSPSIRDCNETINVKIKDYYYLTV